MCGHVDQGLQAWRCPQHHRAKQGAAALCHVPEEGVIPPLLDPVRTDFEHLQ